MRPVSVIWDHSTHAHSAEADVATASRQQSMATTMHGQRVVIGCPCSVAERALVAD